MKTIQLLTVILIAFCLSGCAEALMRSYERSGDYHPYDYYLTKPKTFKKSVLNETVPPDEAAANFKWFRERYYDKKLTDDLNRA